MTVLKVPTSVPLPVEADPAPSAIVMSSAAAITAGVAMASQTQTAAAINEIVTKTADVLDTQTKISKHMLPGIVAASQRIDFLQTQIDELASLVQVGCIAHQKHVCITSLVFNNSRNESERIGRYLAGNWSQETELLLQEQLFQITILNSTCVQPLTRGQFSDWLYSAFSYFKEWLGMGMFSALCCLGVVICLWLLCRFRTRLCRDKAIMVQALAALKQGVSPQVWLSSLKDGL